MYDPDFRKQKMDRASELFYCELDLQLALCDHFEDHHKARRIAHQHRSDLCLVNGQSECMDGTSLQEYAKQIAAKLQKNTEIDYLKMKMPDRPTEPDNSYLKKLSDLHKNGHELTASQKLAVGRYRQQDS